MWFSKMDKNTFGWDLLMKSIQSDSPSPSDLLIAFFHWNLLKKQLKCLGIGDDKTLSPNEKGSELLPKGWNKNKNYSLRYVSGNELFLLCGTQFGDNLIINLIDASSLNSSNITLDIEKTVMKSEGNLKDMIPAYENVIEQLQSTIFKLIRDKLTKTSETQTNLRFKENRSEDIPQNLISERVPVYQPIFPNVGGSDLNPFGSGGSMLFDPSRRLPINPNDPWAGVGGRLPRGAVPPGSRFDPISPPMGERFSNRRVPPDADHFRPPGFDDMFS